PAAALQALVDASLRLAGEANAQPRALPAHFMRAIAAKVSAVRSGASDLLAWLGDVHAALALVRNEHGAVTHGALADAAASTPHRWSAPPEVDVEASAFARWCTSEIASASARLAAQNAERLPTRDHDRVLSFAEPVSVWCDVAAAARRELDESHRTHAVAEALRAEVAGLRTAADNSERELRELSRKEKLVLSQLQAAQQREQSAQRGVETERAELTDQLRQHREALEKLEQENSQLLVSHADLETRLAAAVAAGPGVGGSGVSPAAAAAVVPASTARALRSAQLALSRERGSSIRRDVSLWAPLEYAPRSPPDSVHVFDRQLRKAQASLRVFESHPDPRAPGPRDSMLSMVRRANDLRAKLAELEAVASSW
ncbi:MAG TPA: hypothetical protein VJB16_06590, partial [archaeon]|nr:hypothetical protein [archaeon]